MNFSADMLVTPTIQAALVYIAMNYIPVPPLPGSIYLFLLIIITAMLAKPVAGMILDRIGK
jgi:hypothetical protein